MEGLSSFDMGGPIACWLEEEVGEGLGVPVQHGRRWQEVVRTGEFPFSSRVPVPGLVSRSFRSLTILQVLTQCQLWEILKGRGLFIIKTVLSIIQ